MATHLQIQMNGQRNVFFQPHGLSPEIGKPVKGLWVVESRLQFSEVIDDTLLDLPLSVLGTEVEDEASGFKGTAVDLMLHINGCVHVCVQPKGRLEKTNALIDACDFDIRRLKGAAIKPLTEIQRATDQTVKPSPQHVEPYRPATPEL